MVSRKSLLSCAKVTIAGNEKMTSTTAASIVCEFERSAFGFDPSLFGISVFLERGKIHHLCRRTIGLGGFGYDGRCQTSVLEVHQIKPALIFTLHFRLILAMVCMSDPRSRSDCCPGQEAVPNFFRRGIYLATSIRNHAPP